MSPRRWPLLAVAGAALLTGAVRLLQQGELDIAGGMVATSGFIVLGAWLALEIRDRSDD